MSALAIGDRFGRLVVVAPTFRLTTEFGKRYTFVVVVCDCGTRKSVPTTSLGSGNARFCGCARTTGLTYAGAHTRVRRVRGNARQHECVDCGEEPRTGRTSGVLPTSARAS